MAEYETEGSEGIDSNNSGLDETWNAAALGRETNYGGDWAAGEAQRGNSWLAGERRREAQSARRADATGTGRSSEDAATNDKGGATAGGQNAAREAEGDAPFRSNVGGKAGDDKKKKKKAKGKLRKAAPFMFVLVTIGASVTAFAGIQSLAPFGLVANGLDQFNVLRTSMNLRTAKMANRLVNGASRAVGSGLEKIYGTETLSNTGITTGSRTLKGHIAGWFDSISAKFHNRIGSGRNKFRGIQDDASDDDMYGAARSDDGLDENMKPSEVDDSVEEKVERNTPIDESDPSKGMKTEEVANKIDANDDGGSDGSIKKGETDTSDGGPIHNAMSRRARAVVAAADTGVSIACTILKAMSAINAAMTAIHVANIFNYLTGFLEAIDKTKAGDSTTEIHYYWNGISTRGDTKDAYGNVVRTNTSTLESPAFNQFFSDGGLVVQADDAVAEKFNRDHVAEVSMREGVFSGEVDGTSITSELLKMAGNVVSSAGASIRAYTYCVNLKTAVAVGHLVIDAVELVSAMFTFGITTIIKKAFTEIAKVFWKRTVQAMVGIIMSMMAANLLTYVAQWMTIDLIKDMSGEDAAYAINSGFNMYMGRQMASSSGKPGTESQVMAQYRETQAVIAEEAEYQRSRRSPFDPTSKYTFLGSIVNSLMPMALTLSSPLKTVSRIPSVLGSAVTSLLPTASAVGEVEFETSLNYECPSLMQLELVGDAFCNPYFVTDLSTSDVDMYEVYETVANMWHNFNVTEKEDENGEKVPVVEIVEHSDLAKWVVACAARDSQYGEPDMQVASYTAMTTSSPVLDTIISVGTSVLSIANSASELAHNAVEEANIGWTTGENCASDEYKYYSRYSEDQRLLESAGVIEQSTISAFLDKYYEENPIDYSYEGTIARFSGMSKEQVETTLGLIELNNFLAEYNPSELGPMKPVSDDPYMYEYIDETYVADNVVDGTYPKYVVYADLRTRTLVA